ncbi:hypothetical protein AVEN_264057-1 [Araneus ventricosus]|uniref:Uncharacterized protein n=1 Tax=Araneus ventricosus TaxID=182803 RepID=A0A4Y2RSR3_ARAVE|nr:hypothetical protein AVEN_264057-1 [Araneus ventricosus]
MNSFSSELTTILSSTRMDGERGDPVVIRPSSPPLPTLPESHLIPVNKAAKLRRIGFQDGVLRCEVKKRTRVVKGDPLSGISGNCDREESVRDGEGSSY